MYKGFHNMKHLLITTIATVVLVGCGPRMHKAAEEGNIEVVEKHLADGADVNAKNDNGRTPLDLAKRHPETAKLLRKHGGKTKNELEAAGN